ncbi:hypothetical protein [Streptomyces sp. YIM S03343]
MSTNLAQQALEEAVGTLLKDKVADYVKGLRTTMQETLESTDIEKLGIRLPGGRKVASVVATNPDPKPEITDEEQFLDWVAEHAPGELVERQVTIREVRPAYLTALFAEMTKAKAAEAVTSGGEIVPVNGIRMKEGTRTHSVRFEGDEAKTAVAAAWAAGELRHLVGLRELTGGGAQ